jgi:hypothetical protein
VPYFTVAVRKELPNRGGKYLRSGILAVSDRICLTSSISPNVDGHSGRIFERSKHQSLTLAARKDAFTSRDREGVGACLVPASPG